MNQLKLSQQQSILTLHQAGWSNRAIARELSLNRETVGKYLRSQAAPITAGTELPKPAISTLGSPPEVDSKPAIATTGSLAGRKSCCEAWEQQITTPLPWRRMECEPGLEVQVDFGKGAWIEVAGQRKRSHFFRVVLSHSPKGY